MAADALLAQLDQVKQTGAGRWVARCPAHDDRSPTLSIRETEDGRTLVHCFAGCQTGEVLAAAGLTWSALYPPRNPHDHHTRKVPPVPYADALRCIAHEAWVVLVCAAQIERGGRPSAAEVSRLSTAVERITTACQITGTFR
ncbi:MAG: DNA primase [Gammaproteobacteria bacterium]|nr:DNA primase [Gammaproteobacteria bacterium]